MAAWRARRALAERVRGDVVRLAHSGLPAPAFLGAALGRLRKVVPADAAFFATADPGTLLFTSAVAEDVLAGATARFLENEFLQEDVNKFVGLAGAARPVGGLYAATGHAPDRSPRYRDILRPLGLGDELRAALVTDAACWGFLCLHRARSAPAFAPDEAAFLGRLTTPLAAGLRAALLLDAAGAAAGPDAPGLLVLADDLSVVAATPLGERWVAELSDPPAGNGLPPAIWAVVARLRALERGGAAGAPPALAPRVRLRTRGGRWLVAHASRLAGRGAAGQTAVILEPARPAEVAPLLLRAYALTEREAQVAQLVLRGLPTAEIAARLRVTALTVQQHLKAVFDKTGARPR